MCTNYEFLIFHQNEIEGLLFGIIICDIVSLVLRGCFFIFRDFLGIIRFLVSSSLFFVGSLLLIYCC